MATPSAHLTAEVERRHGAPDRRLRLGSSTFPVHSAVLAAASPVFASLFESFSDEEISLPAAGDAAASPAPPPAACDGRRVSLFLCLLYNHGSASIGSVDDALGVIELGAYWDCPSVLPAADAYLADDVLGSTSVLSYRQDRTYLYSSLAAGHVHRASVDGTQLFHYLSLAAKHKLRR
ncbi:Actin-binding IPP [Micractinium conductrix]|uniref:Actin-binding IPP n=1 Tax=Micractinium conductrix TaxID=554055 RepID=A0A2P6VFK4_9CHLO|nr:Actin-binding IPP [Micractinium conductrix]|eukprot:PSC72870.1 Actin-binding IPP [Micractinium conductrix]